MKTLKYTLILFLLTTALAFGGSGDPVREGRAATAIDIDGGAIDGTPIGANSASTVAASTLTATGDVTLDTPTFFIGNSDNYIGMGSVTSNTNNQLHIILNASKDILIDGSTNARAIDTGAMRFEQRPSIPNTRAVTINLDINGQESSHAQVTNIVATGLVAGETATAYDTNVDRSTSTGGVVRGYEMSISGTGSAVGHLMHADPGIVPISQFSGSFGAVSRAWGEDGSYPDLTISFNTDGTDATIFPANADNIFIGMDAVFDEIEVDLLTFAGGAGIKPEFHYGSGGESPVWEPFTPQDETIGFRQDGVINWFVSDLTTPTWAVSTINTVSKYWIRITRTQVSIPVAPIEKTIQVASTTTYSWDENGDVAINNISGVNASFTGTIVGRNKWGVDVTTSTSHDTTELHGLLYLATAVATVTIDAAADAGYGACVNYRVRDAAEKLTIDLDGAEKFNLAGTALAAGTAVEATGAGQNATFCASTDSDGSGTDGWLIYGETSGWASE